MNFTDWIKHENCEDILKKFKNDLKEILNSQKKKLIPILLMLMIL